MTTRLTRRTFLTTTAAGAAVLGLPLTPRAQAKTFKIGAVHPVTGPLAEPGQACRLGAQMAVEAVNAAGGIKSMGGMKLELILGDTQTKPEIGRVEAERVVNPGRPDAGGLVRLRQHGRDGARSPSSGGCPSSSTSPPPIRSPPTSPSR